MKKRKIITCGVAFNLDDPDQLALYEHAKKRTNFSSYIKRLIVMDMVGIQVKNPINVPKQNNQVTAIETDTEEDNDLLELDLENISKMI